VIKADSQSPAPLLLSSDKPTPDELVLSSPPADKSASEFTTIAHSADKGHNELTPFMRQWTAAKRENPDALLFFRMGDFYELFYDDAAVASRELQLTLTARDRERKQPMCGVPYHAVEGYLARLLRKGYRIALCDQMEDPKLTKKIVRREVTRVLSPGTAMDAGWARSRTIFWRRTLSSGARSGGRDKAGRKAPQGLKPAPFALRDDLAAADGWAAHTRRIPPPGVLRQPPGARSGAGRHRRISIHRLPQQRRDCGWIERSAQPRSAARTRSSGFRRGRASRTGSGRGSLPCRLSSGN
jgi:hypothetical protein